MSSGQEITMALIAASLFINGLNYLFQEDEILGFVEQYREKHFGYEWTEWLSNPLYRCVYCMASIWGTVFYTLLLGGSFIGWVYFCIALVPINGIIHKIAFYED